MKIVIAPDSFKELKSEKCCQAIKAGFDSFRCELYLFADSGWRRRDGGCDGRRDGRQHRDA